MQQYWAGDPDAYDFVGVSQLAKAFRDSGIGARLDADTPDVETGPKGRPSSVVSNEEEDSRQNGSMKRQNGGKHEQESDEQKKRNTLDPLVHDKYGTCPLGVSDRFVRDTICV